MNTTTIAPTVENPIVENYKKTCAERFKQFSYKDQRLVIDFQTRGGYYVRRIFTSGTGEDHVSYYYHNWNEAFNEPFGLIFTRQTGNTGNILSINF